MPSGTPGEQGQEGEQEASSSSVPGEQRNEGEPVASARPAIETPLLTEIHNFETLKGFNELNQPVKLVDFQPGKHRIVWANTWMQKLYGETLAGMQGLDMVEGESHSARIIHDTMFQQVQQRQEVYTIRRTVKPKP